MSQIAKSCQVEGCNRSILARQLCSMHYARFRKSGWKTTHTTRYVSEACTVEGCNKKHFAKGFCRVHYYRAKSGKPLDAQKLCLYCNLPITDRVAHAELHTQCKEKRAKDWYYKKIYDISLTEVETLRRHQRNRCAICYSEEVKLHVDHDHISGVVRGLLCGSCNRGLGLFSDVDEVLLSAIEYLRKPPYLQMVLKRAGVTLP